MGYIIGVDLGTSGTKLAARGPQRLSFQRRPTVRGETLAARAVEQFLDWAEIPRNEVDRLVLTGVRTSFFTRPLLGLPTFTVPEFEAIGRGGMIAGVERVLVVSMGTGTALVMAGPEGCAHLGGSGIGGGTLSGLGLLLLGEGRPDRIGQMALRGRPEKVDLLMGDICRVDLPNLQRDMTAANFGHVAPDAAPEDIALGLVTLVLQSAGLAASFTLRGKDVRDVALTGALTQLPQAREQFDFMEACFHLRFHLSDTAAYATAYGAAVCPEELYTELKADG